MRPFCRHCSKTYRPWNTVRSLAATFGKVTKVILIHWPRTSWDQATSINNQWGDAGFQVAPYFSGWEWTNRIEGRFSMTPATINSDGMFFRITARLFPSWSYCGNDTDESFLMHSYLYCFQCPVDDSQGWRRSKKKSTLSEPMFQLMMCYDGGYTI